MMSAESRTVSAKFFIRLPQVPKKRNQIIYTFLRENIKRNFCQETQSKTFTPGASPQSHRGPPRSGGHPQTGPHGGGRSTIRQWRAGARRFLSHGRFESG